MTRLQAQQEGSGRWCRRMRSCAGIKALEVLKAGSESHANAADP
jgi:hypothetical protein